MKSRYIIMLFPSKIPEASQIVVNALRFRKAGHIGRYAFGCCVVLAFSVLFIFSSCGVSVGHRLDAVESVIEDRPSEALRMLDSISPKREEDIARHALYTFVAEAKVSDNLSNDSLLKIIEGFYSRGGDTHDDMTASYFRGLSAYYDSRPVDALILMKDAEKTAMGLGDSLGLSKIYSGLACIYLDDFNGPKSVEYAVKTVEASRRFDIKNLARNYSRLGSAYSINLEDSLAAIAFEKAIELAAEDDDKELYSFVLSEYGQLKASYGEYDEAYKYLSEADSIGELYPSFKSTFAWLCAKRGDMERADRYMSDMRKDVEEYPDFGGSYIYYQSLIEEEKGNIRTALDLCREIPSFTNSMIKSRMAHEISELHREYSENEAKGLQNELRQSRHIQMLYAVVAFMSVAIICLSVYFRWRKHRIERTLTEQQLESMGNELTLARAVISEREKSIADLEMAWATDNVLMPDLARRSMDTFTELIESLEKLDDSDKKHIGALRKDYFRMVYRKFFTGGDTDNIIYPQVNIKFDNVINHIQEDFPDLQKLTLQIVALSLAGFSNSSIAGILDKEYSMVAKRKSRFCQMVLEKQSAYHEQYRNIFGGNVRMKNTSR